MSTVFLCVAGSSACWMNRLVEVLSREDLGLTLVADGDSLGAQQVCAALMASAELPLVRLQVWQLERQGTAIETLEVWDLPQDFYNLIFLDAAEDADPATFEQRVNNHTREIKTLMQSLASAAIIGVVLDEARLTQIDATERFRLNKFLRGVCQLNLSKCKAVKPLLCVTAPAALAETDEARELWANSHPEIQPILAEFAWRPASETGVQELLALAMLRCDFIQKCYQLLSEAKKSGQTTERWVTLTEGRSLLAKDETLKRVKRYCTLLAEAPWPLTAAIFEPDPPEAIVADIEGLFKGITGISLSTKGLTHAQLEAAIGQLTQCNTRLGELMRKRLLVQVHSTLSAWDERAEQHKIFLFVFLYGLIFALAVACIALALNIFSPIWSI